MKRVSSFDLRSLTPYALALAAVLSWSGAASAAESARAPAVAAPPVLQAAPAGTVLRDDDGGRVQVIPRHPREVVGKPTDHGGPVLQQERVQALFFGSAWLKGDERSKEGTVVSALMRGKEAAGMALEDPVDPAEGTYSDLRIQHRLNDLLVPEGPLGALDPGTVYVIFLARGLDVTLGESSSQRDFFAYHNHFHMASGVAHYVVVPYDAHFDRWVDHARQSLLQALVNPEGNAWY